MTCSNVRPRRLFSNDNNDHHNAHAARQKREEQKGSGSQRPIILRPRQANGPESDRLPPTLNESAMSRFLVTKARLGLPASRRLWPTTLSSASAVSSRFVSSTTPVDDPAFSAEPILEDGEWAGCKRSFMSPLSISVRGAEILTHPLFNKGTAFKSGERDRLRFRGLLPAKVMNIHLQKERFLLAMRQETSNIRKNLMLEDLHDRNETLYHRVIVDHIEEVAPLIYTPTVGQACQEFATRYRRPRGMYFTEEDRGNMAAMVYNWPHKDVHVIVVTDGSRILGLGDLGANGMGIPIGKLSLYCAAGGIAPHRVLPVVIDVGTDNEELRNDKFYLGVSQPRLKGDAYFHMLDEFMAAVRFRWPNVLVQFEDFNSSVAQTLLDKYREDHLCFNDDIQGTGATALAGLLSAIRAKGEEVTALGDQRIVIVGAGSAGMGIAQVLKQAMVEQGRTEEEAIEAFYVVDNKG
jgi:malate dehydrogenase (oxaloacetate-decarboxylating)(NADP+)